MQINAYIQSGNGNPRDILARIYCAPWNHEEMVDLIEWMREHNMAHASSKLSFHGIDIHDGSSHILIDMIVDDMRTSNPSLAGETSARLDCFRFNSIYEIVTFSDTDGECRANIDWVISRVGSRSSQLTRAAELLRQRAEFYVLGKDGGRAPQDLRDLVMAESVRWIDAKNGSRGVVVSAHNVHLGRFKDLQSQAFQPYEWTTMGWHLGEAYGSSYVVFATTTKTGRAAIFPFPGSGLVSEDDGRGNPQRADSRLPRLRYDSIVDLLRASEITPAILDLRVKEVTPANEWLFESDRAFLSFGTMFFPDMYNTFTMHQPLGERFDFLVYIEETSALTFLGHRGRR